ncbi:MAG: O-antigen ligase family protein [Alphaproteobacteria bacterium]
MLALCLCLFPTIGVLVPRSFGFLPAVIGLAFYVFLWTKEKSRPALHKPSVLIALTIYGLAAMSCLWSIDFEISFERCLKMAPVFLGGVLLISVIQNQGAEFFRIFEKYFIYALLLAAGFCVFEMLSFGSLHSAFRGVDVEYTSNLSHLNRSVVIVTLFLFPSLFLLGRYKENCPVRAIVYGALFLILIGIIFYKTDSQSAHLAFLLGFLTLLIFPVRSRLAWKLLFGALAFLLIITPLLTQLLFKVLPPLVEDIYWFRTGYALERFEIWDFITRYMLDSPFIGHGIEATRAVESFATQMLYHKDDTILHPHNFAVQFWMEFGAIGIAVLTAVIAYLIKMMSSQNEHAARMYLATFIAFLSVAATGYGFWQGWYLGLMTLLVVICMAAARGEPQPTDSEAQ